MRLSYAVIIPGSYICSYEDLEDIGLEPGQVRKPLSLYCTVIQVHKENNPYILKIIFTVQTNNRHTHLFHHGMQSDGRKFELAKHHCENLAISKQEHKLNTSVKRALRKNLC